MSTFHSDFGGARNLTPKFSKDFVTVCLSSDDKYAPYLGVCLVSIKANNKSGQNYDVCILDGGISALNKAKICKLVDDSFSIRFVDINFYFDKIDKRIFSLNAHFTIAAYYRLFIPQIFSDYDKVLYLDCDMIINHDLKELFECDLQDKAIGAVLDTEMLRDVNCNGNNYLISKLYMKNYNKYFQSGMLLLNIKKLLGMNFIDKSIERLKKIKNPRFVDQDVLNSIFDGDITFIDSKWNVEWHIPYYIKDLDRQLPVNIYNKYQEDRKNPYIVHYSGAIKPWIKPDVDLADIWWNYARQTPFYEEILYNMVNNHILPILKDVGNYIKNYFTYVGYKVISKVTFGKMRKYYKNKRIFLKEKVRKMRRFLKE